MKSASANLIASLKEDHAIKAIPELIVDWNMNRYLEATADNTPSEESEGFDIEMFPIESIIQANRPGKGTNKARIGSAVVGEDYRYNNNTVRNGRFYLADVGDVYKYWTSPYPSDASGVLTKTRPQVVYSTLAEVNKIVVGTENTWATAKTFEIQVATVPSPSTAQWNKIADQTSVGNAWKASGRIVLYYTGNGWALGPRADKADGLPLTTNIYGVRIVVTALEGGYKTTYDNSLVQTNYRSAGIVADARNVDTTGANSFFDLIEISARLEANLSNYVISFSDDLDMGEASQQYPIGMISTNQASITLSNLYPSANANGAWVPGLFSTNNTESIFRNYIEPNAEVTMNLIYTDEDGVALGKVPEFKMFIDSWGAQGDDTISMEVSDFSKFFDSDESKLRPAMWEGLTVPEIVWRIMDSIGFTNYNVEYNSDLQTDHIIPIFYVDGESNVWETLSQLAEASQTAIYFDSAGVLQVKTRDFAFSPEDSPVWDFTSVSTSQQLANIVQDGLEIGSEFEPNSYRVTYQSASWSPSNRGQPTMQQVWTPEDESVVLRASPLVRAMDATSTWFWLSPAESALWPYEGMVNIEGELIEYKGKIFVYYTGTGEGVANTMVIKSHDEYLSRNSKTPLAIQHKNHFTGAMKTVNRGAWNSETKAHILDAAGYTVHHLVGNNYATGVAGFIHDRQRSRVQLVSSSKSGEDFKVASRGQHSDLPFFNYGTRFRILQDAARVNQCAGLVIHNNGNQESGYYFEFTPSSKLGAKERAARDELTVYSRTGGKNKILGSAAFALAENIDYEVDITWRGDSGTHAISVWVNGKMLFSKAVANADAAPSGGKFGMFAKGSTRAEFEYLYAIRREEESPFMEDFSFLDKVETGYTGGQWDREWVYKLHSKKRRVKKKWVKEQIRFNRTFFDEFGPIVHEIRKFEVKFDPAPVQHSRLYLTNDWSAVCLEYKSDPFGATFYLANTSRRNAVVHGEDTLSFSGTGDAINQVLTVLGRTVIQEEAEEVKAENKTQIRRRGKVEAEIASPWIQSKEMAQDIVDWMNANFSYGNDQVSVEVFGNPLIEIGDVVTLNYPTKHLSGNFFVTKITNDFDGGLATGLTLRRRSN